MSTPMKRDDNDAREVFAVLAGLGVVVFLTFAGIALMTWAGAWQ